jgi:hypothetical protein
MKGVYQIASSLVLLAMTEGGHCGRYPRVVVSPLPPVILTLSEVKGKNLKMLRTGSAWQSQEIKTQKSKCKMTEQKKVKTQKSKSEMRKAFTF